MNLCSESKEDAGSAYEKPWDILFSGNPCLKVTPTTVPRFIKFEGGPSSLLRALMWRRSLSFFWVTVKAGPVVDLDVPFRGETWQNLSLYLPLEATTPTFWISRRLIPCLRAWSHPNIQAVGWRTPGFLPLCASSCWSPPGISSPTLPTPPRENLGTWKIPGN